MQIEIGKRYRNRNTGMICEVTAKCFFNIQHFDTADAEKHTRYTHYKRFQKHYEEVC